MSLAIDLVSFVSRYTGAGSTTLDEPLARPLTRPMRPPNAMTAFLKAPLEARSARCWAERPRLGETKVFMCLHVHRSPERALGKAFEGDGLSQRTGLTSAMIIGAIEVVPPMRARKR
jgi:hypothetical protein